MVPWVLGDPLEPTIWARVRERAIFDCCKWDIQSEDHCVLADYPLILESETWRGLVGLAEELAAETLAAETELVARNDLHSRLNLPRQVQKALSRNKGEGAPVGAARVMRFDFHLTMEGWRISEANTDVPGGFIEASGFTQLMAKHFPSCQAPPDVADAYVEAIAKVAGENAVVGLVHATAHSDDRQVMEYLARKLERRGMRAVLLSPAHIRWNSGHAELVNSSGADASAPRLLVRFYPAEWLPLLSSADVWKPWFRGGKTPMSNSGTALLVQSKRFPLTWNDLRSPVPTWQRLLPETLSPCDVPAVSAEDWVYKPVFGRVGEDIAMAGITEETRYKSLKRDAQRHPDDWVAQRRFESIAIASSCGPRHVCLGVFTIDGRAAGIYGRISSNPLIDQNAQDIAVLISSKEERDVVR
jgi:glutathionylspermidine synthase